MDQGPGSEIPIRAAQRLLKLRKKGESDAEFARRIGLSSQHIYNYKQGKGINLEVVARLADFVTRDDLLFVLTGERGDQGSRDMALKAQAFDEVAALVWRYSESDTAEDALPSGLSIEYEDGVVTVLTRRVSPLTEEEALVVYEAAREYGPVKKIVERGKMSRREVPLPSVTERPKATRSRASAKRGRDALGQKDGTQKGTGKAAGGGRSA